MSVRWVRALALGVVMLLGWSGVAAAQNATYNFSFTQSGASGSGQITVNSMTKAVISIANFVINGNAVILNKTSVVGGSNPSLNSLTAPGIFNTGSNGTGGYLVVSANANPNSGVLYKLFSSGGSDYVSTFNNGNSSGGFQIQPATETFTEVAAPAPGGGLISWLIASVFLGGVGLWRLRGRREAEPPIPSALG